jgi:protein involved in polysaccharide export with SLBB domain
MKTNCAQLALPLLLSLEMFGVCFSASRLSLGQAMPALGDPISSLREAQGIHDFSPTPPLLRRGAPYRLRQGDVLTLSFQLCPEFNQDATVQPDGEISLRGVPSINVVGQSLDEVTTELAHTYSSIMRDPVITVALKDSEKPYFIAAGEVARPGKYDLRSSMTITEAVAIAGGFDKDAKSSQVVLFRPVGDETFQSRVIDVKQLLAERDLNLDAHVLPGDVLYVPKSKMSVIRPYLPSTNVFLNPFTY